MTSERLARQKAIGLVPADTRLPPRNGGVAAWDSLGADERRVFTRLKAAFAEMLDHADQHIGRLIGWLEQSGQLDNTLVLVLSDNGAIQEGGPLGMVNAMGPYNLEPDPFVEVSAPSDEQVQAVLQTTIIRLMKLLTRRGARVRTRQSSPGTEVHRRNRGAV